MTRLAPSILEFILHGFENELVAEQRGPDPGGHPREGPRRAAQRSGLKERDGQLIRHRRRLHGADPEAALFQEVFRAGARVESQMSAVEDAAVGITELPEEKSEPHRDVRHVRNGGEEHTPALEPPSDALQELFWLREMLEHIRANDGVEGLVPLPGMQSILLAPVVVSLSCRRGLRRMRFDAGDERAPVTDGPAQVPARRPQVEQPQTGRQSADPPPKNVVRRAGDLLPYVLFGHGGIINES